MPILGLFNNFNSNRKLHIKCCRIDRKSAEFRGVVLIFLHFPVFEDPHDFTSVKFCRTFPQRKSVIYFLYSFNWANTDKIKFTVAQGRLESEVTFQQIPGAVSDISCPTAMLFEKSCYMSKWEEENILLKAFHFSEVSFFFLFLPLSALILRDWLTKRVLFLVKRELYPQNYHI